MNITDIEYRISWEAEQEYRPVFQITVQMPDGSEEEVSYMPEAVCRDEREAATFAEGFVPELLGE